MGKLLSIWLIELIVSIYDVITLPIYYALQQPWKLRSLATRVRARQIDEFVWANIDSQLDKSNMRSIDTLDQLFRDSVSTFAERDCLGTREILGVEYKDGVAAANGTTTLNGAELAQQQRVVHKYVLADKYTWLTYKRIDSIVTRLSAGLTSLCKESLVNAGDNSHMLLICADTCMQWFLTAHACFRNNITVATAYTSLDDDAIRHSVNQTQVRTLVVSQKFARRVERVCSQTPHVDTVIVLDKPLPGQPDECEYLRETLLGDGDGDGEHSKTTNVKRVLSYDDLLERGAHTQEQLLGVPQADDIAVLMYTSGSTGKAKGVMLSHKSIVYTALSFSGPGDISADDRYIGYLPLGHVLELAAECIFLRNGSTIAYSSPLTLTNSSPMIKRGQYGDAYIFKPTIMGAVPLVLDRVCSGVQQAVRARGTFADQLYNEFVVKYKRYWWDRCYTTPIMNALLCRPFNQILGGRIRAICSGGAALSRDTQEYLRHVLNLTILQGYGLTETSAAASFSDVHERRYNVVGAPYPIVHIKLESWSDYSVHDKPHPRGEIVIGGQPVSSGYYKMDELTRESFYVDERTGMRFFRTGDIGLMLPDGVLKIIDRKKDIVKPLSGEYISLNEIEAAMKTVRVIENICVYCSPYSNYIVAIVKPDVNELRSLAKELHPQDYSLESIPLEKICADKRIVKHVHDQMQTQAKTHKLKRTQTPSKIRLVDDEWSPESGLVTASFKLRRREVEKFYAHVIRDLYAELGQKIEQTPS